MADDDDEEEEEEEAEPGPEEEEEDEEDEEEEEEADDDDGVDDDDAPAPAPRSLFDSLSAPAASPIACKPEPSADRPAPLPAAAEAAPAAEDDDLVEDGPLPASSADWSLSTKTDMLRIFPVGLAALIVCLIAATHLSASSTLGVDSSS